MHHSPPLRRLSLQLLLLHNRQVLLNLHLLLLLLKLILQSLRSRSRPQQKSNHCLPSSPRPDRQCILRQRPRRTALLPSLLIHLLLRTTSLLHLFTTHHQHISQQAKTRRRNDQVRNTSTLFKYLVRLLERNLRVSVENDSPSLPPPASQAPRLATTRPSQSQRSQLRRLRCWRSRSCRKIPAVQTAERRRLNGQVPTSASLCASLVRDHIAR